MKPRLCSAALTREDWEILVDIREHHQRWRGSNLLAMSQHSDRRDADLMLEAREAGAVSVTIMRSPHGRHEVSVWWEFGKMRGWKS